MKNHYWKQEYKVLLASPSKSDCEKAFALKAAHLPNKIYRYRNFTSESMAWRINEILSGEIYLSHPESLNDPLEACSMVTSRTYASYSAGKELYMACLKNDLTPQQFEAIFSSENWHYELLKTVVDKSCPFTPEKKKHIAESLLDATMKEVANGNERINQLSRNMMRIACFTTKADNLPMWNHYADSHKGICLEYSTADIVESAIKEKLFPVLYVDQLPDMMHLSAVHSIPKKSPEYLASHKLNDWRYEDEWRLLYTIADFSKDLNDVTSEMWKQGKNIEFVRPSRIIIGLATPDASEKMLRNLAKHLDIAVSKVTQKEFGIEIV